MGWGRVRLLERIGRLGSIAAAARSMHMSYRNAWLEVETMNRLAPAPLVEKITGGVGGGHTRLTEDGRKVINEYKELRARFLCDVSRCFAHFGERRYHPTPATKVSGSTDYSAFSK